MNSFTIIFLIFLSLYAAVQAWLAQRHIAHVEANRDRVPEAFKDRISLEEHRKAAEYTTTKTGFGRWDLLAEIVVLLLWTLGGGLELLDSLWRGFELPELATGVGVMLSMLLVGTLIDLPFSAYRTFVIEERFGFNHTTPRIFFSDLLKQTLLMLLLGGPLAAAILWLLINSGTLWWLYAWLVWMGFSLVMLWVFPVFIAPLFNKFEPLTDETLYERVTQLLERNGLSSNGIFVMDGSRRSGHGNAYFTGLGENKRIVFYDTLLESLDADEVEAVLAHEIGHYKRKHIRKMVIVMGLLSLFGLAILGQIIQHDWFYHGLGVTQPSGHMALLLFMLISPAFTFVLSPVTAWLSRRHEFEADDFAAEQADAATMVRALVKLYAENAATLTPDPLHSAFHDSHPPAPVRVAHLLAGTEQGGTA